MRFLSTLVSTKHYIPFTQWHLNFSIALICLSFTTAPEAAPIIVNDDRNGSSVSGVDVTDADAVNGSVTIQTGAVVGGVHGGWATRGNANNNTVTMTGGNVGFIEGGYAYASSIYSGSATYNANNNTVSINGGTVTGDVSAGYSDTGETNYNNITVLNGTVDEVSGGDATAGSTQNTVTIKGGRIKGLVSAGHSFEGSATNNTVVITGGEIQKLVIAGGSEKKTAASKNNTVTITGGTMLDGVYGGAVAAGTASNNVVNIRGGIIKKEVGGGLVANGTATNNIVNIEGGTFDPNVVLYGYNIWDARYGNTSAGTDNGTSKNNTVNIKVNTLAIKNIKNVGNLHFYLPKTVVNGNTVVQLSDAAGTDLTGAVIGVRAMPGTTLKAGDKVTLIDAQQLKTDNNLSNNTRKMDAGLLSYDFTLQNIGNKQLVATVTQGVANSKSSNVVASYFSPIATVIHSGNMTFNTGLNSALDATQQYEAALGSNERYAQLGGKTKIADYATPWVAFGTVSAANSKYDDESDLKIKPVGGLLGLARRINTPMGHLVLGGFYEHGRASFNTSQTLNNVTYAGSGKSRYQGGGVLANFNTNNGLYLNASLSGGRVKTNYDSNNLAISYDTRAGYMNAHLGAGYMHDLTPKLRLDASAKYAYSRVGGDNFTVLNSPVRMHAITSNRLIPELRLNYQHNPQITSYIGLGLEHEFSAKAAGSVLGVNMPVSSLKGTTGFAKAGIRMRPSTTAPIHLNFNVQGFAGKRKGGQATLNVQYDF